MNAEYVSKLIAENIDKEVLVNILSGRIRQQQAEIENLKAGLLSHHDIYPVKELTDEEITAIWQTDECYQKAQAFARAILRKAQEK